MRLDLVRNHNSIFQFNSIELPNFTLITGLNGSGKTHLLEAINNGAIKTDIVSDNPNVAPEIKMFNWSNFVPQDSNHYSSSSDYSERQQILISYRNAFEKGNLLTIAYDFLKNFNLKNINLEEYQNPYRLLSKGENFWIEKGLSKDEAKSLLMNFKITAQHADAYIFQNVYDYAKDHIQNIAKRLNCSFAEIGEEEIMSPDFPLWGRTNLFEHSIEKIFVAYRDTFLKNELAKLAFSHGKAVTVLSPQEFEETYGPPPWDFVNKALSNANLDFSINSPSQFNYDPYISRLEKRSTKAQISFSSLSSGEKILLSFAFCIYYASDLRQITKRPKLVLLDEIDATLHPSMSKNVIEIIVKNLVVDFGLKVIATTHSPSTVALAPENSIYSMSAGEAGLRKISKSAALDLLTVGVPTLSLSFDGRRQVFVENSTDAKVYSLIYELIKPSLMSERSLEFIASGLRYGSSDINMGCDVVKNIVAQLEKGGNQSVFGLIDFDGKNKSSSRILVMSEGNRDGIENIIYDPLLLALLIFRKYKDKKQLFGFSEDVSYIALCNATSENLQEVCDKVSFLLFDTAPSNLRDSYYVGDDTVGNVVLKLDERHFLMDDHELADLIGRKFEFLLDLIKHKPPGNLMLYIVENILSDNPKFVPLDFKDTMKELLEKSF